MRNLIIASLSIILVSFVMGMYLYPAMPESMASHWDAQGNVNGYMPKFWGLFLIPLISLGLLLLFLVIPRIDPLKHNIKKFMNYYQGMVLIILIFLLYIDMLSVLWNLGYVFDMPQMIIPPMGLLFIYLGFLLKKAKRNWFIGIRTPWTLSNEKVWDRTHMLGGKVFKAVGVIILFGIVFPQHAILFIMIPVFVSVAYLIAYSYLEYQKETKKKK